MKKVFAIVSLVVLVWSCSHKITPSKTETPSSNPGTVISVNDKSASTTNNTATSTTAVTSSTSATPTGARTVDRTAAESSPAMLGQQTFSSKCARCHGLKVVSDYTADRWISIMQVMATKANLSDTEKQNVLAYVTLNAKK